MPPKVLVVTGPTATGKTALGATLAKKLGGEVVSADSMQIYKFMNIGTAKPSEEERLGVCHHMLDVAEPFEPYSAAKYVEQASKCTDDIIKCGKLPVIVGGTGLYIESLIFGRDFAPTGGDETVRRRLEEQYDALGGEEMIRRLSEKDPERAAKLHPNDKRRVVRALEVLEVGGGPISQHDEQTKKRPPRYDAAVIVLNFKDREELYRRIDKRVDDMMEKGLEREVRDLLNMGFDEKCTAMQAIGYKELLSAMRGEWTLEDAVETVKRESRRYAKRQISWCQRYKNALRINWESNPNFDEALRVSTAFAYDNGII